MLVLAAIVLGQTAVTTGDEISAIAWHPSGESLYYTTEKQLVEWPSRKSYEIKEAPNAWSGAHTMIDFNKAGTKALLHNIYTEKIDIFDLRKGKVTPVVGDCYTAWWWGDEVARVRPNREPDGSWGGGQYIQVGNRKRQLPKEWTVAAADPTGQVFLGKSNRSYMGPMALLTIDRKSLRPRIMRRDASKFYVEYVEQDAIAWNPRLRIAAVNLTADTGASTASLWIWASKGAKQVTIGPAFMVMGKPQWVGDELLCVLSGNDQSSRHLEVVVLYNPRTGRHRTLHKRDVYYRFDPSTGLTTPDISTQPYVSNAALSPDGKRLALVLSSRSGSEIVVKSVTVR